MNKGYNVFSTITETGVTDIGGLEIVGIKARYFYNELSTISDGVYYLPICQIRSHNIEKSTVSFEVYSRETAAFGLDYYGKFNFTSRSEYEYFTCVNYYDNGTNTIFNYEDLIAFKVGSGQYDIYKKIIVTDSTDDLDSFIVNYLSFDSKVYANYVFFNNPIYNIPADCTAYEHDANVVKLYTQADIDAKGYTKTIPATYDLNLELNAGNNVTIVKTIDTGKIKYSISSTGGSGTDINLHNGSGDNSLYQNLANNQVGANSLALGSSTASGDYSTAEGNGTTASGLGSHSTGLQTVASGDYSTAEGNATTASGLGSHSSGLHTTASGDYSTAEGFSTSATANNAHAEGEYTQATANNAHAEGYYTEAKGSDSHAEGYQCKTAINTDGAHAEGNETNAKASYSHSEGGNTIASGGESHAEGHSTISSGSASHSEGINTEASGSYSHAEGNNSEAIGSNSHAEGSEVTIASGDSSHAEGRNTKASGSVSHAEGNKTEASGINSHAEGDNTIASGANTHAEGQYTKALNICENAKGRFNESHSNDTTYGTTLFSIGIGNSDTERKNAIEINQAGTIWFYDSNGNKISLQSLVTRVENIGG